ncbi:lysophospholipase L1-like esterase [Scopulibacillus darangshiensis]|uniref:Lysophospholipase L1-like esterase n=1 Tax=Scopulibacillus darangshiensis TaxID=442528 RepID=A0A4R2NY78_9BACL|nr:SGNH/GDSL hydrolase family protein [Scopulibacillus darangshiensis]TCP27037.1 lysophospholipase L1-like esterase [Scopulibacillus darangshiensis]
MPTYKTQLAIKQVPVHIVGLGDSLTKGVGDLDNQGYVGDVASRLKKMDAISKVKIDDFGVRGDTSEDLLKVLDRDDVKKQIKTADYIFLTIGGNDLVNVLKKNFLNLKLDDFKKRKASFESNLNDIILKIRKQNPNATIYYFGLYNPFENYVDGLDDKFSSIINQWNQTSESILAIYRHTVFIPTADIFHGQTDHLLYNDHFHPNEKGYKLLAQRLFSYIQKQ